MKTFKVNNFDYYHDTSDKIMSEWTDKISRSVRILETWDMLCKCGMIKATDPKMQPLIDQIVSQTENNVKEWNNRI